MRKAVATALGKVGVDEAAWQLVREYLYLDYDSWRASGARAAGLMVTQPAVRDALRPLLTDYGQVSWLRKEAALALSPALPDPWKVTPLGALLDERDVEAAEAAYATLSKWYAAERRVSA